MHNYAIFSLTTEKPEKDFIFNLDINTADIVYLL